MVFCFTVGDLRGICTIALKESDNYPNAFLNAFSSGTLVTPQLYHFPSTGELFSETSFKSAIFTGKKLKYMSWSSYEEKIPYLLPCEARIGNALGKK